MPTMLNEFFDSKYIRAEDLGTREVQVIIAGIQPIKMNDGQRKAVLLFEGKKKGLVLNKTNASKLASAYGQDMEAWQGHPVILFADQTSFQGQMVPCVRLRIPAAPKSEPGDDAAPLPF